MATHHPTRTATPHHRDTFDRDASPIVGHRWTHDDGATVTVVRPRMAPSGRTWGWTVRGVDRYADPIVWGDHRDRMDAYHHAAATVDTYDHRPDRWTIRVVRVGDRGASDVVAHHDGVTVAHGGDPRGWRTVDPERTP